MAHNVLGWLADGTPTYAPVGRLLVDGDRVCCHLCGSWFLSVASHLRVHGWTRSDYVASFGLELSNPLAGPATRKRRAAALAARQAYEVAIQKAQAEARDRCRSGALTVAAATAARGRPHPPQRRVKTLATLAGISASTRAEGSRAWARRRRETIAAQVAARFGYADFAAYVAARLQAGLSLAAISREAGLHKDWVSRHLPAIAPEIAGARHEARPHSAVRRLASTAERLGFVSVESYLRQAHSQEHRTVAEIAAQSSTSSAVVEAALRELGIPRVPHAGKRHGAAQRDEAVSRSLGYDSLAGYVIQRRREGATWRSLVLESGVPESTLRRFSRREPVGRQ